jgi:signal peptidase I
MMNSWFSAIVCRQSFSILAVANPDEIWPDPAQPTPTRTKTLMNPAPQKAQPPENTWKDWAVTLGLSAVIALSARTFIGEPRYIPTGSMIPTLLINDRLLVDKVTYRFRAPERSDIIVFNPPPALAEEGMKDALIKRIVGIPGDTIEVRDGKVYRNQQPLEEGYINAAPNYTMNACLVPPDSYFVLGDNRNDSQDGSLWSDRNRTRTRLCADRSFVPRDKIIGRATVRFWPFNRIGGINPSP